MTIALSMKVHDGVVLAADSAATIYQSDASGNQRRVNVYFTAEKICNLFKGLPIGFVSWGLGSIGRISTTTLAKDLQKRFMGLDSKHADWTLNVGNYSIEEIAKGCRTFFFDEQYVPAYANADRKPYFGFVVAGYSSGQDLAEAWEVTIDNGECTGPKLDRPKEKTGFSWFGDPEAITRLVLGFGTGLEEALRDLGVPDNEIIPAVDKIRDRLAVDLLPAPMPIKDVIDLADFLINTTIEYNRFLPGVSTVGGPVEIAAITKHEGFKWIRRKFFYDRRMNEGGSET